MDCTAASVDWRRVVLAALLAIAREVLDVL